MTHTRRGACARGAGQGGGAGEPRRWAGPELGPRVPAAAGGGGRLSAARAALAGGRPAQRPGLMGLAHKYSYTC